MSQRLRITFWNFVKLQLVSKPVTTFTYTDIEIHLDRRRSHPPSVINVKVSIMIMIDVKDNHFQLKKKVP
jgi:hypothetical protein